MLLNRRGSFCSSEGGNKKDSGVNVRKIHHMKIPYLKLSKNKQRYINKDMKKIRKKERWGYKFI